MKLKKYKRPVLIYIILVLNSMTFTALCQEYNSRICPPNLILNPEFEIFNGCNVDYPDCTYGNIGNCVQNWSIDHGTPHHHTVICPVIDLDPPPNSFIRCASKNDNEGEGVFQLVELTPGATYQMCLWINSSTNTSAQSSVRISLADNSPGLPGQGICRALPGPGFIDVFNENAINFINGWHFRSFLFTVPSESLFDRIILRRIGGDDTTARLSSFDNITMFEIPVSPAYPPQMLDHCCLEVPCGIALGLNPNRQGSSPSDIATWQVNIYPNPATEKELYISSNEEISEVYIYDTAGRLVSLIHDGGKYIDLTSFQQGNYLLRIVNHKAETSTHQVTIE